MKTGYKNFKFKHSLGQNFIVDEFLLDDIATESGITKDDFVLEIGPGNGALTKCLSDRAKCVVAVEVDNTLMPLLKSNLSDYKNVTIINADFLEMDFNQIISAFKSYDDINKTDKSLDMQANEICDVKVSAYNFHIKVVANLPYYITSPILNSLLLNPYISEMTLMVQKEVAERIIAVPNTRDYGILTLACNYFSDTDMLMVVSKECFYPKPKVDSAVVHFKKYEKYIDLSDENNFHIEDDDNYKKLFKLIKASFSQRRKKLSNSLSNVLGFDKNLIADAFSKLRFDENVRAENLSLDDYKNLLSLLFTDEK